MSRKPADKLRPDQTRAAIWTAIRSLDRSYLPSFGMSEIARMVDLDASTIRDYLSGLAAAGYLEDVSGENQRRGIPRAYRLIKDAGLEAPRVRKDGSPVTQGLGREQTWRALGIMAQKGTRFTVRDLTLYATTKDCPVVESDVKYYIHCLTYAGYVMVATASKPGTPAVYRMPRNKWTGPRPVQIQRVRRTFDPNTGAAVHIGVISVEGGE